MAHDPSDHQHHAAAPAGAVDAFESLDPDDWPALRALAHRMIDDAFDDMQSVRERPVWRQVPAEIASAFTTPAPRTPEGAESAYREFRERVAPYRLGNDHPRFWAWYLGTGTPIGALAAFLAAAVNGNAGGANHAGNLVEQQVVRWCADIVGFPEGTSGLMTGGGSMANLIGLAVARSVHAEGDVREGGLRAQAQDMVVYASSETHTSNQRAVELFGLGRASYRQLPVDQGYRLDLGALERAVTEDRAAGRRPCCVIGNAGTINTGAVDDLTAIADFCAREGLWFHVDGAIGAMACLSARLRPQFRGIERADSLALDLHKWMHVPFEAGLALVRDEAAHRRTFTLTPDYLEHTVRGIAAGDTWFSDYGMQLSRDVKALKAWMAFKTHGLDVYGRLMERNVEQAQRLAARVEREADLELMAPVGLNIVCFRAAPAGSSEAERDALNRELVLQVQESGVAATSYTTLRGRYCLRAAIANHRTRDDDIDLFVDTLLDLLPTSAAAVAGS
jgi:aromatic-L-amino-acid/L-tryptophan decarboxylase